MRDYFGYLSAFARELNSYI